MINTQTTNETIIKLGDKSMSRKNILNTTFGIFYFILFAPVVIAQFPTDGVVGYWPFDSGTINGNTVQDVIGQNNGELNGNPNVVTGKVDKALEFNGENFVIIPGTDTLDFNGAEEMTVAAWVNAAEDSPVIGVVAGCCGNIVAQRDLNSWALRFDGRNAGQEYEFITMPSWQGDSGFGIAFFAKNEWHHIVAIVDGNKKYLYADGKLENDIDYNGPMQSEGIETVIGKASDGGFIGLIDEVVIYDRALTENEVMQLYTAEGLPVQPKDKLTTSWGKIKASF